MITVIISVLSSLSWGVACWLIWKNRQRWRQIDAVVAKAEKLQPKYTIIEPLNVENGEHLAGLAEAATNKFLRALLLRLRDEACEDMAGESDVGNRALGRISAFDGIGKALDVYAMQYAEMTDG